MKVILTPEAVRDLEEVTDHCADIDPDLGERFLAAVDAAVERLQLFPRGAPPVEGFDALRRARMRHFPYGLFYQPTATGDLLVVRVLHSRRDRQDALESQDT
ncbi:type II toxin-antitoxin system RelE/ParE family toxin [Citricoccus sp. NPDC055426]|uniref:type II toxin-antitoxin system RelE/ParE family toxin n=1 Tax=Citricoccus sp. NPDC055426 TaxID=3155536 RepID=UPI00343561F1